MTDVFVPCLCLQYWIKFPFICITLLYVYGVWITETYININAAAIWLRPWKEPQWRNTMISYNRMPCPCRSLFGSKTSLPCNSQVASPRQNNTKTYDSTVSSMTRLFTLLKLGAALCLSATLWRNWWIDFHIIYRTYRLLHKKQSETFWGCCIQPLG